MNEKNKVNRKLVVGVAVAGIFLILVGALFLEVVRAADPGGPSVINITSNTTKSSTAARMVNISGGYVAKLNVTANLQNTRWKAFVGGVTGKFTLDDSSGSTIYDWTLSVTNGRVYATRVSSTIAWAGMRCANTTILEQENFLMNHTNADDNITATFSQVNHTDFYAGAVYFPENTCNKTINTYVNNVSQSGTNHFDEVALTDATNIVYATILEQNETGYDGNLYDFQMIVPENGAPSFTGATAYYMYIEIT